MEIENEKMIGERREKEGDKQNKNKMQTPKKIEKKSELREKKEKK